MDKSYMQDARSQFRCACNPSCVSQATVWVFPIVAALIGTNMTTQAYKTDFDWSRECDYINYTTLDALSKWPATIKKALANFSGDRYCLVRYCEMQRDCATRDGHHDSAQYIQHCIDDLTD
jgi:hypothetical protein